MKVLYSHPLTAPSAPLPEGFHKVANEADLSLTFWNLFAFLRKLGLGSLSEHAVRLYLAAVFWRSRSRHDVVISGRYGEFFAVLQSLWGWGLKPFLLLDVEWYKIHSHSWRSRLNRWLHQRMVEGASRIQVFCHAEARNYAAYFGVDESKFVWIPYCADPLPVPQPVPEREDFIFTSGTHQRDYATLLEAVEGLPVELRIAAPRSAFAGRSIPANVKILGPLPPTEYQRVLWASRFVVLSLDPHVIRRPGVITYVSAMQAGKCVVVNDPDGASSYVEEGTTGFLVPGGDAAALRHQILQLMEQPSLVERIGAQAREAAQNRFSARCYFPLVTQAASKVKDSSQTDR